MIPKKKPVDNFSNEIIKDYVVALDGVVEWGELFPRNGRPDLRRKKQTRHTIKKIREVLDELRDRNSLQSLYGKKSAFRKMRKSPLRKDAQSVYDVPKYFKGVFVTSIAEDVKIKRDKHGKVVVVQNFKSGAVLTSTLHKINHDKIKVDADLKRQLSTIKKKVIKNGADNVAIRNGENMFNLEHVDNYDKFAGEFTALYMRYADAVGESREDGKGNKKGVYYHPKEWMLGVDEVHRK